MAYRLHVNRFDKFWEVGVFCFLDLAIATDCHGYPPIATDWHRLPPSRWYRCILSTSLKLQFISKKENQLENCIRNNQIKSTISEKGIIFSWKSAENQLKINRKSAKKYLKIQLPIKLTNKVLWWLKLILVNDDFNECIWINELWLVCNLQKVW